MSLHGHYWTFIPHFYGAVRRPRLSRCIPWSARGPDGVRIDGRLHVPRRPATDLIVMVHGLGSDHDRPYLRSGAGAAIDAGAAVLRLALRGAGDTPRALYHAAQLIDLQTVLASPALREYARIHFMGYSLGGHLALWLAVTSDDPRLGRVASLCAPLDLAATQQHIDHPRRIFYRHNLMVGMKTAYRHLVRSGVAEVPWSTVKALRTIRQWDDAIVVPYFGFGSVDNYYATASIGPRLRELKRDALFIATVDDPMIPVESLRPWLDAPRLTSRLLRSGGHVYFPKDAHLGLSDRAGVEAQTVDWLLRGASAA